MIDICLIFFFKQKTAYEMRISDWSSDVCSSDLLLDCLPGDGLRHLEPFRAADPAAGDAGNQVPGSGIPEQDRDPVDLHHLEQHGHDGAEEDRKSVVSGKSVSVRVDLGGRRIIKKKQRKK